jgi:hypothetical protein
MRVCEVIKRLQSLPQNAKTKITAESIDKFVIKPKFDIVVKPAIELTKSERLTCGKLTYARYEGRMKIYLEDALNCNDKKAIVILAKNSRGTVLGWAIITKARPYMNWYSNYGGNNSEVNFYVNRKYRNLGIGSKLFSEFKKIKKKMKKEIGYHWEPSTQRYCY